MSPIWGAWGESLSCSDLGPLSMNSHQGYKSNSSARSRGRQTMKSPWGHPETLWGQSNRQHVTLGPLVSKLYSCVLHCICHWLLKISSELWLQNLTSISCYKHMIFSLLVLTRHTHTQRHPCPFYWCSSPSPQRAYYFTEVLLGAWAAAALSSVFIY